MGVSVGEYCCNVGHYVIGSSFIATDVGSTLLDDVINLGFTSETIVHFL